MVAEKLLLEDVRVAWRMSEVHGGRLRVIVVGIVLTEPKGGYKCLVLGAGVG